MGMDLPDVERVVQFGLPPAPSLSDIWQRFRRAMRNEMMHTAVLQHITDKPERDKKVIAPVALSLGCTPRQVGMAPSSGQVHPLAHRRLRRVSYCLGIITVW
jgi:ATP-dependent helicase YprA (DUF1998 family)